MPRLAAVAMGIGALLAVAAMHGAMHDGDGTSLLTVSQAHVVTALPGLPWLLGLVALFPCVPRRLVPRAAVCIAAAGAAVLFTGNLLAANPRLHDDWDFGLLGLGLLVIALPVAALSTRELTTAWVRVSSVCVVPTVVVGTFIGNALVEGGGEWATNILLFGGIALTLLGLSLHLGSKPIPIQDDRSQSPLL